MVFAIKLYAGDIASATLMNRLLAVNGLVDFGVNAAATLSIVWKVWYDQFLSQNGPENNLPWTGDIAYF